MSSDNLHAIRAVMNNPPSSDFFKSESQTPGMSARQRLADLLAALPKGSQRRIASRCRCSPATVSNVLNGKQTQTSDLAINIIRCAEAMVR